MPGPTLELDSSQVPLLLLVKETMEGKRRARKDELWVVSLWENKKDRRERTQTSVPSDSVNKYILSLSSSSSFSVRFVHLFHTGPPGHTVCLCYCCCCCCSLLTKCLIIIIYSTTVSDQHHQRPQQRVHQIQQQEEEEQLIEEPKINYLSSKFLWPFQSDLIS